MRQDQYLRLQALVEKIAEAIILDADPEFWTAAGIKANELSQEQRGDAYWCRKMASASLSVMTKVLVLTNMVERRMVSDSPIEEKSTEGVDLGKQIKAAEREAALILKRAQSRVDERKH